MLFSVTSRELGGGKHNSIIYGPEGKYLNGWVKLKCDRFLTCFKKFVSDNQSQTLQNRLTGNPGFLIMRTTWIYAIVFFL
jgi:hypothetical protein